MLTRKQFGFTLVELVIVMAITSLLATVAFIGQAQLRGRAQFDASVDQLVTSVANARDQATAGVNTVGAGNGAAPCAGGPAGQYVFAGVAWTADNSLSAASGSPIELEYYEALTGSGPACIFQKQAVSLPAGLTVSVGAQPGSRELFVRTGNGGLAECPVSLTANAAGVFAAGNCASGALTLDLTGSSGRTAQVIIDSSGLAKRLN